MTVRTTEARVFVAPERAEDRFLPEGPQQVTVGGRPAVAWVNIQTAPDATAGAVRLRFWDTGEVRTVPLADRPGFIRATDRADTLFVGMGREVGLLNAASGQYQRLATLPGADPRTIVNDGTVVPGGRAVVFGTKDTKFKDSIAHLYLYTADDHRVTDLAGGQLCSNGKVFDADEHGLFLFDIDTPRKVVTRYKFDLEKRAITEDGIAVNLRNQPASPDGMTGCGDDTVIIAFFNGHSDGAGRAGRYRLSTGELLEDWSVPGSPRVTCPLLVRREDGVKMILTTADEGMPAEVRAKCPNAGCLFIADTTLADVPAMEPLRIGD